MDREYKKSLFGVAKPGAWIDLTQERKDKIMAELQEKIEAILTQLDHDLDDTLRQAGVPYHVARTFKLVPNGE